MHFSGAVKLGNNAGTCDESNDGGLRYNNSTKTLEICDTRQWQDLITSADSGSPPLSSDTGYFVITNDRFDGNLGGQDGANEKCVTDLQTYDWLGKSGMQVDSDHVFAFICYDGWKCQHLVPNQTYTFAVSGDNTLGGANFVTDSNGYGPGNNEAWNDNAHFGSGIKHYWSSERASTDSTKWANADGNAGDANKRCGDGSGNGWSNNSAAQTGEAGATAFYGRGYTNSSRWARSSLTCDTTAHLLCMVNP